jgi:hypothetical protein
VGFAKLLRVFKKGSKAASGAKGKGKKPSDGFDWPSGLRIGVYGHANSGKTVYFTVLNEESKIAKNLQISVTDNATAGQFLTNYRAIWGLGTSTDVGTVVDLRGERKFPDPTKTDRVLQFNAIVDRSKKLSIVTYDYPGHSVSISNPDDLRDKVVDFMTGCDGILFFFDPKTLQAELQTQAHVASFVNMLELLAPLSARVPIPIALVVTKADILDGFTDENQVVLISAEDEHLLSEDFELFLEKVLSNSRISSNPAWAGSVRNILVKLREFLKVVVGRTLDFQVFFVSNTGQTPEKIGTDVGRSVYKPPEKISPTGVKEPFYWLLKSIVRNRKISRLRSVAKYVAILTVIWLVVFSAPFLFHFKYLLPKATDAEGNIMEAYDGNIVNTTDDERTKIISAYSKYERSWTVKWLFPKFLAPSGRIRAEYGAFNLSGAISRLEQTIGRFQSIVEDSTLWPKLNPSDTTIIENDEHKALVADLEGFHQGEAGSELFARSERVLRYWELFAAYIAGRADSSALSAITEQVQFDARTFGKDISKAEEALGRALLNNLKARTEKKVKKEVAIKAAAQLDDKFAEINSNSSPAYRLGEAVTELKKLKAQLDPSVDAANIRAINRYLETAEEFTKKRKYTFKVESIPGDGHLHVEVVSPGQDPTWSKQSQTVQGFEYGVEWKVGDHIHIALDTLNAPENWGKTSSDKKILTEKYSMFNMDGEISFDNLRQKVVIRFIPPLVERLPELKK